MSCFTVEKEGTHLHVLFFSCLSQYFDKFWWIYHRFCHFFCMRLKRISVDHAICHSKLCLLSEWWPTFHIVFHIHLTFPKTGFVHEFVVAYFTIYELKKSQSVSQSVGQPVSQSVDQMKKRASEQVSKWVSQWVSEWESESVSQPRSQSVSDNHFC